MTRAVAREEQRLVEAARQQGARRERPGQHDVGDVAQPLPRAREYLLSRGGERCIARVERWIERVRARDVGIDVVSHAGHCRSFASRCRARATARATTRL